MKTLGQMTDAQSQPRSAFWPSVFIGAYGGVILQMLATLRGGAVDPSELWVIPVLLLFYGLLTVPFVALGLSFFGLPVTGAIRRWAQSWWVGPLAVLWGGLAGKLMFYGIDHLMFFGQYSISEIGFSDMGLFYGVPTGLAWWVLHRRELARR